MAEPAKKIIELGEKEKYQTVVKEIEKYIKTKNFADLKQTIQLFNLKLQKMFSEDIMVFKQNIKKEGNDWLGKHTIYSNTNGQDGYYWSTTVTVLINDELKANYDTSGSTDKSGRREIIIITASSDGIIRKFKCRKIKSYYHGLGKPEEKVLLRDVIIKFKNGQIKKIYFQKHLDYNTIIDRGYDYRPPNVFVTYQLKL